MYVPEDDLLIVPLPDLILGFAGAFLVAEPPLTEMNPLPERFTLPDALAALMPVARDLRFATLLTVPLPDLILGLLLAADFLYAPEDVLLTVPRPDLILGLPLLDFDFPDLTFLVLVPLFTVTLTMNMRSF